MTLRYVLTHPEMGIYLGSCLGMGWWTLLDPVGQPSACTFASEAEAFDYVRTWDENNDPAAYTCRPVQVAGTDADIAALKAAGLGDMLGDMEADALRFAEPSGNA